MGHRQRRRSKAQQALNKLDANVLKRLGQKPRPMKRSAQGGIVELSNGGSVNDPYGIGALGEEGIPRFDYPTNRDRSLITLLKNILKGGMLKPENRPAPANNKGIVSKFGTRYLPDGEKVSPRLPSSYQLVSTGEQNCNNCSLYISNKV